MTPKSSTPNPIEDAILDKLQSLQKNSIYRSDQEGKRSKKFAADILDWPIGSSKQESE
jgi:hypothetical protein